jgi:hypothetical protein
MPDMEGESVESECTLSWSQIDELNQVECLKVIPCPGPEMLRNGESIDLRCSAVPHIDTPWRPYICSPGAHRVHS